MMQGKARTISVAVALLVGGGALAGCGSNATDSRAASAGNSSPAGTTGTAPASAAASSSSASPATSTPSESSTSSTPGGSSAPTAGPVLIVRTAGGDVSFDGRRPTTIGFSGDSSNVVTNLTWSSWGPSTAVGEGSWGHDDCQPNCAQGTVTQVPATIHLSDVVDGHFTAITEQAQGLNHTYRYPSHWATSARAS